MKKVFRVLIWFVIGLVIALLLVPFLFKGQIQEAIKTEINKQVNAEVQFEDISLSLLKNFPSLSIDIQGLGIIGINEFKGMPLMKAERVFLKTDLKSIIKAEEGITINSIILNKPDINLLVNAEGKANYDISKTTKEASETGASFFGQVESYKIEDGKLSYIDSQSNLKTILHDIDHEGAGNFKDIIFDLDTKTAIASVDFSSDGITYLNGAQIKADANLGIDLEKQLYKFNDNIIRLNDLDLAFDGDIQMQREDIALDLTISAPNNKVSSILSLIPTVYKESVGNITSEGNSFLSGSVVGIYNSAKKIYPKISLKANVENGSVQYPGLPLPIKDINLDLDIFSTASDLSDLLIDFKSLSFLVDQDRMIGKMKVSNALENPKVNGLLDGTLNLANISKAYPLEGYDLKKGVVITKMEIDADVKDIEAKNFNAIGFNGNITAKDLDLVYDKYPVKGEEVNFKLNPKTVSGSFENVFVGESDFTGTLNINNPLAFISNTAEANSKLIARSKKLNLDQLMSYSNGDEVVADTIMQDLSLYEELNITASYQAEQVVYEDYTITQLNAKGSYEDDKLTLGNSTVILNNEPIALRGESQNVSGYIFKEEKLTGKFFLDADNIDANKFLNEDQSSEELTEVVVVPKNLEIDLYPEIKKLKYDTYELDQVEGKINISNGVMSLTDGSSRALGGKINIDGLYDSSDPTKPLFDLRYNMSQVDFGKIFESSESFKLLAPFAKYINGLFNSTMVMAGPLGQDMMPDLNKVTASGFLETLKGQISGFEPAAKLGTALGIDKLKDFSINGSKNWFDVKDGKVILKPHEHIIDDMSFTLGGTHSIAQELDYTINAVIPRDKLAKDKLGKNLEFGMDYLEKEASSRGVNIDLGEMIYLDIFVTGTIKNPKFKITPVGSGGKSLKDVVTDKVTEQIGLLKDTVTQELEKKTEAIKDTVTKVVQARVDTIADKAKEKAKTEIDKQKDALKDKLKSKLDTSVTKVLSDTLQSSIENKAKDILGDDAQQGIDSLKSKIKDWNPFKKKKN